MNQTTKVKFAMEGQIARITLNRSEKLNALDPEMLAALEDAVSETEQSREVRGLSSKPSEKRRFAWVPIFWLGQRSPRSICGRNGYGGAIGSSIGSSA
jgi:hypothetical protein